MAARCETLSCIDTAAVKGGCAMRFVGEVKAEDSVSLDKFALVYTSPGS